MMEAQETSSPPPLIPPPYLSQKVPGILISWDQGVETHPSPTSHCPWQFPHGVSSSARKPPPAPCQGVQFLGKLPPLLPINCSEMPPLLQGWKCHSWGTAEKNSFIFLGQALPSSTQSPHDRRNWRGEEKWPALELRGPAQSSWCGPGWNAIEYPRH